MTFKWKALLRPRNIALAALAAAVAIFIAQLVQTSNTQTPIHPGTPSALPSVVQQSPGTTSIGAVNKAFGPFVPLNAFLSNTPDLMFPRLLLINEDGSESASKGYTVVFNAKTWSHQSMPQIVAVSVTKQGFVIFKLDDANSPNTYIVQLRQPFVLEESPINVIYFAPDGSQWVQSSVVANHSPHEVG